MEIEIWFDFICPFCYLGMTKFEMALNNFEHKDDVRITYRSFQLNMSSDSTKGKDINQVISERYNISYEEAKVNNDNIIKAASDVGLNYKFDILKLNSTTFAHKLAIYAKQSNKEQSIIKHFSKGYFEEGLDIGNEDDLISIASKVGLDMNDFENQLSSGVLDKEIENNEIIAKQLGINSLPFFVIDNKYAISGARDPKDFLTALNQAYLSKTEENKTKI